MSGTRPRPAIPTILLTNDDGPPSAESPFLHGFVQVLRKEWARDIRVVVPNSQRSWIGKAYLINSDLQGSYYYTPSKTGNGRDGEICNEKKTTTSDVEEEEWVILDGTPASCTNIATQCLYPDEIDLIISGPNYGRNTSSAFALSSGTIGAALDGALTDIPSIALSYGIFTRPIQDDWVDQAHQISIKILKQLWQIGFSKTSNADLYSVNIPMVPTIMKDPKVVWTTEAITRYGKLFAHASSNATRFTHQNLTSPHPSALPPTDSSTAALTVTPPKEVVTKHTSLSFIFAPDIQALIDPNATIHAEGTDAEALNKGWCTVTPLKAAFRPATRPEDGQDRFWRL